MTFRLSSPLASRLLLAAAAFSIAGSAAAEISAKFAVTLPEKSHQGQGVARFVELVAKKSNGNIKIKPFYSAALGNDVQVTSALQGGTIEFTVPQTSTLTGMVKEFEILDYPFLFDNEKEVEAVLDGPIGKKLIDKLPEKGLVGLTYWENGFFNITNSKRPINSVEDFSGLKLRAVQAKISQETIKALGANPVPLAVPELYTALETKTVDGQGTPTAFIPLVSKKFWDKLSEADRKILLDAAVEARSYQRSVAREQARTAQEAMVAKGLAVNNVTPAARAKMRDKVKPVWSMFEKDVGADLSKEVFAELDKLRK